MQIKQDRKEILYTYKYDKREDGCGISQELCEASSHLTVV